MSVLEKRLRHTLEHLDGPSLPTATASKPQENLALKASANAANEGYQLSVAALCVLSSSTVGWHQLLGLPKPVALLLGAGTAWVLMGSFLKSRWAASRLWRQTFWRRQKQK